jgi:hypothetical protein
MNIHHIIYHCIRILSIVSIAGLLSVGFILPISFVQALVINPVILVSLMVIFAVSNNKLNSIKPVNNIVHLPNNSKCKLCSTRKAA